MNDDFLEGDFDMAEEGLLVQASLRQQLEMQSALLTTEMERLIKLISEGGRERVDRSTSIDIQLRMLHAKYTVIGNYIEELLDCIELIEETELTLDQLNS